MEIWKNIYGLGGKFEVSNMGRIKSHVGGDDRILKSRINNTGMVQHAFRINQKRYDLCVHKLVAIAFLKNKKPEHTQVNHIDSNKLNNNVENLEWCTCSENIQHFFDSGFTKDSSIKLNKYSVRVIKKLIELNETQEYIASIFNVSATHICNISKGRVWKNI